ncbi:hypothetical protein EBZ39_02760 [bacterium]|nr:hypothetical protein [bacterium]
MLHDKLAQNGVRGHVTLWRVCDDTGLKTPVHAQPNQIQFSWGFIAAQQLGFRPAPNRPSYHISAMYVEFENQTNPGDAVQVPAFGRDLNTNYYNSLVSASTHDFLRIPLTLAPATSVSTGYEANLSVDQQANKLTFFVQTAGTTGVFGKTFSHTVNSKIFAAALVAAPEFGDRTKDVIFARTIFNADAQLTKEASSQIGITWDIAFE